MKYLVTGGCGFIGSNLVRTLVNKGHDVTIIDNLSTGSIDNIKPLDLQIVNSIEKINLLGGFDGIFHLGMPSSTPLYREDRKLVGKTISEFIIIMEHAKEYKTKVVYASSSSLYNGNKIPFKEDMNIIPTDFYTETRYAIERLSKVYYDFYDVKSIGLRLFSVYGDNERSKGRFANLVSQILWAKESGEVFDVYNKGETLRDFIHVDDVVEAFIKAMDSSIGWDIFNIGTGKAYTINDIIKAVGLRNYRYVETPLKNYVTETLADTSKAERVLGFKAKIDVMDYIKKKVSL
ncbi:MAG: nucleoside-diphosphate sugar epimerase [Candidatus Aenigmatarchaeota archaeon]|nr:MAG: nucleoside-diphosphate sugar epimerase [Candidatus Aenigmarchaeota archaeon]